LGCEKLRPAEDRIGAGEEAERLRFLAYGVSSVETEMPRLEVLEEPLQRSRHAGALVGRSRLTIGQGGDECVYCAAAAIGHTVIRFTAP
jgi:hypothetical protein